MEQIYMLELFIDSVTINPSEDDTSGSDKKLIVKINFGPKSTMIIKEKELVPDDSTPEDVQEGNSWTRVIRAGKSFIFPSFPDTVLIELSKFPLELEVWTDDEKETQIFVGLGLMEWSKDFFHKLKQYLNPNELVEPLVLKQIVPLKAECCCRFCGHVTFILRLSCLGDSVLTEFQELKSSPNKFVFRTNRAPTTMECKRIGDEDLNFCMIGSLYETTTLEAPEVVPQEVIVCTDQNICESGYGICPNPSATESGMKIKMGSISGPCGSVNCPLVHKIKKYIRQTPAYKKAAGDKPQPDKEKTPEKGQVPVCGMCVCPDDTWHRSTCPEMTGQKKKNKKDDDVCKDCQGNKKMCVDKKKKDKDSKKSILKDNSNVVQCLTHIYSVDSHDKQSKSTTQLHKNIKSYTIQQNKSYTNHKQKYLDQQDLKICEECGGIYDFGFKNQPLAGKIDILLNYEFFDESKKIDPDKNNALIDCNLFMGSPEELVWDDLAKTSGADHRVKQVYVVNQVPNFKDAVSKKNLKSENIDFNYYVNLSKEKPELNTVQVYNCTVPDNNNKECRCDPVKPKPPCNTFDCNCITEMANKVARKAHRSYCPLYKHKPQCPVNQTQDPEGSTEQVEEENVEPLPYGLPPIKLGPCPVLGRPCTAPDGFARMYKTAALQSLPPSYSDAGKVCCSKEFQRIKNAISEFMKYDKLNECDTTCVEQFMNNIDARCCDKEQVLAQMAGKSCCGPHKLQSKDSKKH